MTDVGFQTTINYGGVGRYSVGLLRELAGYCDHITVYPTALSVEHPAEHEWWVDMPDNITVRPRQGYPTSFLRDTRAFSAHDVVHVNYASLGLPALVDNALSDIPYVYTVHHFDSPSAVTDDRILQLIYFLESRVCLRQVAKRGTVVTVSEYNRDRLESVLGVSPAVIYHGIDVGEFEEARTGSVRNRYGLPPDSSILLFVGKFHGYKEVPNLLAAYELVRRSTHDVELVLISGGGKDGVRIRESIRTRGLTDDVTVIESIPDDDLRAFYHEASLFVLPSPNEAFGIVLLEAMASGLPVVYVDAGAAPEVVDDAGQPVPNGDARALAETITGLLEDEARRRELATRGAERVRTFTWDQAARSYARIYRSLAADGRAPNDGGTDP